MTGKPFTPAREDGRALWNVVHDYLCGRLDDGSLSVGDTVPHRILLEAAGLDSPATAYYSAVSRTVRELQKDRHRSLRVVRGQGYQVIAGKAHMESGEVHHTRARKSMGKALSGHGTAGYGLAGHGKAFSGLGMAGPGTARLGFLRAWHGRVRHGGAG